MTFKPAPMTLEGWKQVPSGPIRKYDLIQENSSSFLIVADEKHENVPVQKFYAVYRKA